MKRIPLLVFLAVFIALPACSEEGEPDTADGTTEETVDVAVPTEDSPPPPAVLGGAVIQKVTDDGVAVATEYINVEGAPPRGGVILVHMLGHTRADWDPLVEHLIRKGLDVIAIDLRGHGQSAYGALDFTNFETGEWLGCTHDIRSSLDYLTEKVDGPYFLIGASIGANLVLMEAAEDERVAGVVMLSPGLDFRGVKPGEKVVEYGERPALLVAAKDDTYSCETVEALAGDFADAETKLYTTGGHGTHMFAPRPEVLTFIADWLETHIEE